MKISVVGLGYVGAVTSCCLAKEGHEVLGIDLDPDKVALLQSGTSPVIEEGIDEITSAAIASGRLQVTTELTQAAVDQDLIFVCVGTPSAANGSQDLTALERVCHQIGSLLEFADTQPSVVIRSTIPPGTTDDILHPILEGASNKTAGRDFGLGFQPEFLREGSSVNDFHNPPMTIVGGDALATDSVERLFAAFPGEFIATDVRSAELLKVACNTFHAVKVNFANEMGRISRSLGMDARVVMDLLCQDTQLNISRAYLRPGFAFGGSCLPKDLRALLHVAKSNDVDVPMLQGILPSNDEHIESVARMIMSHDSRKVGLVGLSFKQGTDDLRESPLVRLAEILIGKGYELSIYDPAVRVAMLIGSNKRFIESTIPHFSGLMKDSLHEVVETAGTVVVAHKHAELADIVARLPDTTQVVDLVGLDPVGEAGFHGVAW